MVEENKDLLNELMDGKDVWTFKALYQKANKNKEKFEKFSGWIPLFSEILNKFFLN